MTSIKQQCNKRQDHDACSNAMLQAGIGAETTKKQSVVTCCEHVYKRSSSILRLLRSSYGMQLALPSFLKLGWGFALPQDSYKDRKIAKQALQSKNTEQTIGHDPEQCKPRGGSKRIVDKAVMYQTC